MAVPMEHEVEWGNQQHEAMKPPGVATIITLGTPHQARSIFSILYEFSLISLLKLSFF